MKAPHSTNRGVYTPPPKVGELLQTTEIDAYTASVDEEPPYLRSRLVDMLTANGEDVTIKPGNPGKWYGQNDLLVDKNGKRLVALYFGGENGRPLVQCTGHASPWIFALLRGGFAHTPSRIDACLDRHREGLFDEMIPISRGIARKYGLGWYLPGDWETKDAGRTIQLGSRKSQSCLRIYEKGLEMAHKQGLPITDELRHLVRFEVEFKPQNPQARKMARTIQPAQMWGLTDWLTDFAQRAFEVEAERVKVTMRREADYERALRFMCRQYRTHLQTLLEECGGDLDRFAVEILERADLLQDAAA